ncbi:condensation domain-containing protein [Kitasatospora sp. LaBMicrA B282]|uniref:condensation domain-containing protein n=1 Tax=Kitasatospora sp. LaBMicrA B282 TaxID=3420949 RepID=UPI003D0ABD27
MLLQTKSILEWQPEPGKLVRFVPEATPTAGWIHPSPPTALQEAHVKKRVLDAQLGHVDAPWLALAFDLPGPFDTAAMERTLVRWVRRHGTLRTWFTQDNRGRLQRRSVHRDSVKFSTVALSGRRSSDELGECILDYFRQATDPTRWPLLAAGAIVREQRSSTFFLAVDHAHSDGFSVLLALHELNAIYREETGGPSASLPDVGSHVEFSALEREREAKICATHPAVRRWVDFWRRGPLDFAVPLGVGPGNSHPGVVVLEELFDAAEAEAFSKACTAHGGGTTAGLYAAFAVCAHELVGQDLYRGIGVVHTRDSARWQAAQGWFVKTIPVTVPVVAGQLFSEAVSTAQRSSSTMRKLEAVSPSRLAELSPDVQQAAAGVAAPLFSYIDTRHVPGSLDWGTANCHVLLDRPHTSTVSIWVNRYWDCTRLGGYYPDTPIARVTVPLFLGEVKRVLKEVAHSGDYRVGRNSKH